MKPYDFTSKKSVNNNKCFFHCLKTMGKDGSNPISILLHISLPILAIILIVCINIHYE